MSFSSTGPTVSNSLPFDIRSINSDRLLKHIYYATFLLGMLQGLPLCQVLLHYAIAYCAIQKCTQLFYLECWAMLSFTTFLTFIHNSDENIPVSIPVQNLTKNHTIPLSVRTRLLELLCVFNCSPYFSSCGTACDLHLWVGRDVWRLVSSANKLTRQGVTKKISFLSRTTIRTNHVATIEWHNDLQA